ncbi:VirB4 family type IV secretion system protein [Sedimentibacter sp. zth1]|uniref:VirB4 family type IV secretion system protein n=1 Tax=Sedimentibacter sp. zth1 TaxID=2816908 RepID=UPI001A910F0F|nr:DUF87 domain-containing protein [Sedimentibacter sp. zth1]QSX05460.1 VirB4 family type IV secretion system protein [Sedimentibacter sp. zth1]
MKKKKKKINILEESDNFLIEGTIGNLDLILPDGVLDYDDYIKLSSDKFVRIFAVLVHMHESYVGCFDFLFEELGENIDSTDHIEPISSSKAINALTREITIVKSNENLKNNSNMDNDEGALQVISDLENLKKQIQLGTEKLFFVRKIFRVWGKSKQELEDNCKIFKEKCEGRSLIVKELLLNQAEGLKTSLPSPYLGVIPSKFKKNFSAASLAGILPEGMTDFGHKRGIPLGSLAKKNSPFIYNFFEGPPTLPNPMAVLIGTSGSGKSTLMKLIRARSSILGAWNIGLDLEGEFEKITERTGGHYINIRAGEKTGINPMDLEVEEDEKGRKFIDIQGKVAEIRELLNIFCTKFNNKPLDGMEIARIEDVVRELYYKRDIRSNEPDSLYIKSTVNTNEGFIITGAKKEMPILSDVKKELEKYDETKKLAILMKMITGEGSLALFDCQTSIVIEPGVGLTFGLKNIKDNFTKFFSLMNIMTFLWATLSKVEYKTIEKIVEIDEGWFIVSYEEIGAILESFDRRGRKYKISLIIGSQLADEFISSKAGKVIISIAETKILLRQTETSAKGIIQQLNLPSNYASYLQSFDPGDAIFISGGKKVLADIQYYDFEKEYVET